eukprot:m51a1_g1842 putative probable importin subunit beta-4-like (1087) ;mRNA; f:568834-573287
MSQPPAYQLVSSAEDVQRMAQLLRELTANDTATVMAATRALNTALRSPGAVAVLLDVMCASPDATMRQMAAVMLRKRVGGHWPKLSDAAKAHVKNALMQRVAYDDNHQVRGSVAEVVGVVAKMALPAGQWPELLPFLNQCVQSPNLSHREAALKLFGVLTDTILNDERNRGHKRFILKVLAHCIQDPSNNMSVRIAAVVAVGSLVRWLDSEAEVAEFRDTMLPHMLEVVRHCVQTSQEQPVILAFEVFDELMETETRAGTACIPVLVQFSLEVVANTNLELPIRQIAFTFVEWVARFKPKFMVKNHLLKPVLDVLFAMCAEPEDEDADDDETESAHKFAAEMIDLLSEVLPSRRLYAEAIQTISKQLQASDPNVIKSGLGALAVLAENCFQSMKEHLREIMPFVLRAFTHPNKQVRSMGLITLSEFSLHLVPEIIDYHTDVMPAMLQAMNDADVSLQRKGLMVFEAFASALGDRVVPYAPRLVEHLVKLAMTGPADVRDVAVVGISAVAESCGDAFAPFFPTVGPLLVSLAGLKGPDDLLLRGRAIECLGSLSKVVGRETFALIQGAIESLSAESPYAYDVADMVFGFFADIVELYGPEFAPFLPQIMPYVHRMIESTEGLATDSNAHDGDAAVEEQQQNVELEDDEESDSDEDDGDQLEIGVHMAFLEAKSSACNCAGEIAKRTGALFTPYVEQIATLLLQHKDYAYQSVRASVMFALPCMLDPLVPSVPAAPEPLPQAVQTLLSHVMNAIIGAVQDDDSRDVVMNALDGISHVCQILGERAVQPFFDRISEVVLKVLKRDTCCQSEEADGADEEEEEAADQDEPDEDREIALFETIGEVIVELTHVYKDRLLPWFSQTIPLFARLLRPENAHYYRSLSIATLAEFVRISGVNPSQMLPTLFGFVLAGLSDENENVRRNSAFCCGVVLSQSGEAAAPYLGEALRLIGQMLQLPAGTCAAVRDNAVGAVSRMAMACPAAIPIDQMLPVWLAALPLQDDKEEYTPAFTFLLWLARMAPDVAARNMPALLAAVARVAAGPAAAGIPQAVAGQAREFVRVLAAQGAPFTQALQQLGQEAQAVLAGLASA